MRNYCEEQQLKAIRRLSSPQGTIGSQRSSTSHRRDPTPDHPRAGEPNVPSEPNASQALWRAATGKPRRCRRGPADAARPDHGGGNTAAIPLSREPACAPAGAAYARRNRSRFAKVAG